MISVKANPCELLNLGREGENLARAVEFDLTAWQQKLGDGHPELLAQRAGDLQPYPVPLDVEGGKAVWRVTNADTAKVGYGQAELHYYVGAALAKSATYETYVENALGEPTETPPEPQQGWVDKVVGIGAEVAENAQKAETAEQKAQAAQRDAVTYAKNALDSALAAAQSAAAAARVAQEAQTASASAQENARAAALAAEAATISSRAAQTAASAAEAAQAAAISAQAAAISAQAQAAEHAADAERLAASAKSDAETCHQILEQIDNILAGFSAQLDKKIQTIWTIGKANAISTETVTGKSHSISVPSEAKPYAELRMIGGMSRKGNNLLIDAKVDRITSRGINLIDWGNPVNKRYISDVSLASNALTVIGSEGAYSHLSYNLPTEFLSKNGQQLAFRCDSIVSENPDAIASIQLVAVVDGETQYLSFWGSRYGQFHDVTIPSGNITALMLYVRPNNSASSIANTLVIANPRLVVTENADKPYAPYFEHTIEIPDAIKALPDYGIGINADCYNYVDYASKKYHHKVSSFDLGKGYVAPTGTLWDGEQSRMNIGNIPGLKAVPDSTQVPNIMCALFSAASRYHVYNHREDNTMCVSSGTDGGLLVYASTYPTSGSEFKAAMDGVLLYYELAEEEVIDISDILSDDFCFIPVEADGTVTFHYPALDTGSELPVPSEMRYQMEINIKPVSKTAAMSQPVGKDVDGTLWTAAGGGVGQNDHNQLINRDADNQHPISAIAGLDDALLGKQDTIPDLDGIRSGAAAGGTALQKVPPSYRTASAQDEIDDELKNALKPVTNKTETPVAAGKVWTSTEDGAGWLDAQGGGGVYELIDEITEDSTEGKIYRIYQEPNGDEYNFKKIILVVNSGGTNMSGNYRVVFAHVNKSWRFDGLYSVIQAGTALNRIFVSCEQICSVWKSLYSKVHTNGVAQGAYVDYDLINTAYDRITGVQFAGTKIIGTTYTIYGVRS